MGGNCWSRARPLTKLASSSISKIVAGVRILWFPLLWTWECVSIAPYSRKDTILCRRGAWRRYAR